MYYDQVSITVHKSSGCSQSQYTINSLSFINYFSEHQLPHVIDASHATPTTHVNRGSELLKLIGWRHYPYFRWISYIPETTAQSPGADQVLPLGSQ